MKTEKKIATWQKLITLLEAGTSIPQAALALHVSGRTIYRYLSHPAFQQLRANQNVTQCAEAYALGRTY